MTLPSRTLAGHFSKSTLTLTQFNNLGPFLPNLSPPSLGWDLMAGDESCETRFFGLSKAARTQGARSGVLTVDQRHNSTVPAAFSKVVLFYNIDIQ